MTQTLEEKAKEKSTYIIACAFTDEDDEAVTPSFVSWTLTDQKGNIINDREDVEVSLLSTSIEVVLSGDDLQILSTETNYKYAYRLFTLHVVYNSDAGSNLSVNTEIRFLLENLININ